LIILVVTKAHQCFLRTGYGMEGCLTDALTTSIFNKEMKPFFKENNWDEGILSGLDACLEVIYKDYNDNGGFLSKKEEKNFWKELFNSPYFYAYLILGVLVLLFVFVRISSQVKKINDITRAEAYENLKKDSKKWDTIFIFCGIWLLPLFYVYRKKILRKIRYKKVKCSCGEKMNLLSEKQEDDYLSDTEQFEETLKSRDYDVWLCNKCGKVRVYPYEINNSYTTCSTCSAKALKRIATATIVEPTYTRSGVQRITYVCKHCKHQYSKDLRIPKLTKPTPIVFAGSGGSSGSSGGFSGGGFSGGMSGGGGGGGSW
ncbi:MAG: TPM domain-containing protein, partial [Bacteroidota bacterium]|nr:TPM domain-containing protein [Bacteroidota bacterium]